MGSGSEGRYFRMLRRLSSDKMRCLLSSRDIVMVQRSVTLESKALLRMFPAM